MINASHDFYRVHFPGNPVTPGVCLLQMATEILEQRYHKSFLLCGGRSIKFKKLVVPSDNPVFVFHKTVMADGQLTTLITIEDGESQFVKMSLEYKVKE